MSTQVFGAVNRNGSTLITGSGNWSATRVAAGVYEITFATPFAAQPVVVASGYIPREQGGAASDNTFSVGPITTNGVKVRTFDVESKDVDNAGEAQDSEFTFIAIGA
ncbi:MAG: hypothetical protein R3C14_43050 [Caldilineaceae bacterium]